MTQFLEELWHPSAGALRQVVEFPAFAYDGALFSTDEVYRYALWRNVLRRAPELDWSSSRDSVLFIMLNPSTASGVEDDQTVRKCVAYARKWLFRRLLVGNVAALRARDPEVLKKHAGDVFGRDNAVVLQRLMLHADLVVCAWGVNVSDFLPQALDYVRSIEQSLSVRRPLHYLRLAKAGDPCHPLYLPSYLMPQPWVA